MSLIITIEKYIMNCNLYLKVLKCDEYVNKMKIVMVTANISKDRKAIIARFLNSLNKDIINVIELQHYLEIEDTVHMCKKMKTKLKKYIYMREITGMLLLLSLLQLILR